MTTDDLYDMVRTFRSDHGLPDPKYTTLLPTAPMVSLHFAEPASTLGLDVEWRFLSASGDEVTMSAHARIGDNYASIIAPYGEVTA